MAVFSAAAQSHRNAPPPRLAPHPAQSQRFLLQRGIRPGTALAQLQLKPQLRPQPQFAAGAAVWQPLGPVSVSTPHYGPISGRISSLALDPSDHTGNTLYIGTTGGGVWFSSNAASDPSYTTFTPLTDAVSDLNGPLPATVSIGALTVQAANSKVILAGTGDPNDALDSYYGGGILRSDDAGVTWKLIPQSSDSDLGTGNYNFSFLGLGFAGFAWSDKAPQTVVAAVSDSYQGQLVSSAWPSPRSAGLYYSTDAGIHWSLATVTDLNGQNVQDPMSSIAPTEGNPATAVIWNPIRQRFFAAIRYHGYYESRDGITWTQLPAQPGTGFTPANCPTNSTFPGSPACPIFRGVLAVNPITGDTFAWSVDLANQDQGLWQDLCTKGTNGQCTNSDVTFGVQLTTTQLQENIPGQGSATIRNGDYDFTLAALPVGQDTMLLAGANDLWQCTIAPPSGAPMTSVHCDWRNTTNAQTCLSARVGPYQHALAWNMTTPSEIFVGNDSGLWRSLDAIAESSVKDPEPVCSSTDASHFQNLNATLGSLAEVQSMSASPATPYTMMLGLGVNGTAGVKNDSPTTTPWPQILSGEGGPNAIDPSNPENWYVNNGAGVSIHLCSQSDPCKQADFGTAPLITNADVSNDGLTMTEPAPFLVDPADPAQLLVATCRIWRGPATGGWSSSNAITPMLGSGASSAYCSGNPLIRTLAALKLPDGGEVLYAGTYGSLDGGATMPGHILKAVMDTSGTWSSWQDLTFSPVQNDIQPFNAYSHGISSIVLDPADNTGNTVYLTIQGFDQSSRTVYRSADGGAAWYQLSSNLPAAPANALAIDPLDPNTIYVATDTGVYSTRTISTCAEDGSACWAPMGSGLPISPVTTLSATPAGGSPNTLVAGTYGRGVWQIPLFTAGELPATATLTPGSLTFPDQPVHTASNPLELTVTNTSGVGLSLTSVTLSGDDATDFSKTDDCANQEIVAGAHCTIHILFLPSATGSRNATITVAGNITGGSQTATLTGTGTPGGKITILSGDGHAALDFGSVAVNSQSEPQELTAENSGADAVTVSSLAITPPFQISFNGCGTAFPFTLAASRGCSLSIIFAPAASGRTTGTLTMTDDTGVHTVQLSGNGTAPPTDTLSPTSLSFPDTVVGQPSSAQTITITNSGENPLTGIELSVDGPFTQTTNCTTQLAAQSTCAINVVFLPTAASPATGALTLIDTFSATPRTVALSGTGLNPPQLTPSPTSIDFGKVPAGALSDPQTITVTNTGGAPMANVGFNLTGQNAISFSVDRTVCAAKLAVGASCVGKVAFAPDSTTGATASLAISSSTRGVAPASVVLLGNGGAPGSGIQLSPASVTFNPTGVGAASAPATITVTNLNPVQALANLAFTITNGFTITANTCDKTLAAGASCKISVTFTPAANAVPGPETGTLSIASSALLDPATVALSGTGFDFTLTASGADTITVASGQTAIFTLKLATLGGVPESFAFQCIIPATAAPAACPTIAATNIAGNASGTQTISVTTSKSIASASPALSSALLAASGLLLFPLALRKRRNLLLLLAMLAITLGSVTSCVGSSGGKSGSGGGGGINTTTTKPGTYTIPIWASVNGYTPVPAGTPCNAAAKQTGAQRCINLTMIVD